MNPGMKMMLISGSRDGGGDRRDRGRDRERRSNGNYDARYDMRYGGGESRYEPTDGRYDRRETSGNDGPEMRGRRRRRYDNGRFAPMRNGMSYGYEPDDDDDEPDDAYRPEMYSGEMEPRRKMNPIGFSAGSHSNVTELHRAEGNKAHGGKLDKADAEGWVRSMKNEDGTTGPHWTMEQAKQVMAQKGVTGEPVEFWAALNMVYSDYCKVAKKLGVNNIDFYVEMARAFLEDKDAGEGKLLNYYEYVVK